MKITLKYYIFTDALAFDKQCKVLRKLFEESEIEEWQLSKLKNEPGKLYVSMKSSNGHIKQTKYTIIDATDYKDLLTDIRNFPQPHLDKDENSKYIFHQKNYNLQKYL